MENHFAPPPPDPATPETRRRTGRAIASHFLAGALIGLVLSMIAAVYYTELFGELTLSLFERVGAIALVFGLLAAIFGETLVDAKPLRGLAKFLDSFPTVF